MGDRTYTGITSLDDCISDASGNFDWSIPDEEVHSFVNKLARRRQSCLLDNLA